MTENLDLTYYVRAIGRRVYRKSDRKVQAVVKGFKTRPLKFKLERNGRSWWVEESSLARNWDFR